MVVGIDRMSFFVPPTFVDMAALANARGVDPNKYLIGIGQERMAVAQKTQDIVTLAMNAATRIVDDEDRNTIDLVLFATESSVDESKAAAVTVHHLLGLNPFARSVELKQACFAGTAALQMALDHVRLRPNSRVLVIAADIAKYGLKSGGEPTQGAGAVAMIVSHNPKLLAFQQDCVSLTRDTYDFWRPTGETYPRVDGALSKQAYIDAFRTVLGEYGRRFGGSLDGSLFGSLAGSLSHASSDPLGAFLSDYQALLFHMPYTKMGLKALNSVLDEEMGDAHDAVACQGAGVQLRERLTCAYQTSAAYGRQIGNLYTGSLYVSLMSYLEQRGPYDGGDDRPIGLFSYGSGLVAEFFTARVIPGFDQHLLIDEHASMLNERTELTVEQYEQLFEDSLDMRVDAQFDDPLAFSIEAVRGGIRYYRQ